ncbi:hypothetical protein JB92DRAFT_2981640 [Gautieria morchelliformis]|nr:hypothetical protein JB92DRAFT_2981640 [Gautieria morchelliformis]
MKHMLAFLLLPMVVTALQGSPPIRRPGTEPLRASEGKTLAGLLGRQSTCGSLGLCPNTDFCCLSGGLCCAQTCCLSGTKCNRQGDACCHQSDSLCGDGCCFAGTYCDQFTQCCPNGEICVEGPGGTSLSTFTFGSTTFQFPTSTTPSTAFQTTPSSTSSLAFSSTLPSLSPSFVSIAPTFPTTSTTPTIPIPTTQTALASQLGATSTFIPSASSAANSASKLSIIMPRSGLLGTGVLVLCFTFHV